MNRGEIWWVNFGQSVGNEVTKTRPALVVSNEGANLRMGWALVVPLTTSIHTVHRTETLVQFNGGTSKAMIDQMRVADNGRFGRFVESLSEIETTKVVEKIKEYLDIA